MINEKENHGKNSIEIHKNEWPNQKKIINKDINSCEIERYLDQ